MFDAWKYTEPDDARWHRLGYPRPVGNGPAVSPCGERPDTSRGLKMLTRSDGRFPAEGPICLACWSTAAELPDDSIGGVGMMALLHQESNGGAVLPVLASATPGRLTEEDLAYGVKVMREHYDRHVDGIAVSRARWAMEAPVPVWVSDSLPDDKALIFCTSAVRDGQGHPALVVVA